MDLTLVPGKVISNNGPCFIIAEVGQNHQGDINIAKQLIQAAKDAGADCVKFQKTSISTKFNRLALERPYVSPNSWGSTYGEHKRHLEFSCKEFGELQAFAKSIGIPFTASAHDEDSVDVLDALGVPFIKIGSGENVNIRLLRRAASTGRPLVVSTGMMTEAHVIKLHAFLTEIGARFCLLHCVSAYPTDPEFVNLRVISELQAKLPNVYVGYSGHELGTNISIAAVSLGAKILERHITLDTTMKGTDHSSSLNPQSFAALVQGVREVEKALGKPRKNFLPCEMSCWLKLGKTIVAARPISAGSVLSRDDLMVKVAEPRGIAAGLLEEVIGLKLNVEKQMDESILEQDVELRSYNVQHDSFVNYFPSTKSTDNTEMCHHMQF